MLQQQIGDHIYIALARATLAAIASVVHPAIPLDPVQFLLLTSAPEAAAAAAAIGEDLDALTPAAMNKETKPSPGRKDVQWP